MCFFAQPGVCAGGDGSAGCCVCLWFSSVCKEDGNKQTCGFSLRMEQFPGTQQDKLLNKFGQLGRPSLVPHSKDISSGLTGNDRHCGIVNSVTSGPGCHSLAL